MFMPRVVSIPKKAVIGKQSLRAKKDKSEPNSEHEVKCMVGASKDEEVLLECNPPTLTNISSHSTVLSNSTSIATSSNASKEDNSFELSDDSSESDEVIEHSKKQRWPRPGEPVCIVCGRYGAYICDRTDCDICSIECKKKNLANDIKKRISIQLRKDGNSSAIQTSAIKEDSIDKCKESDKLSLDHTINDNEVFLKYFDANYSYIEHPTVLKFTRENIDFLREKLDIKVQGENLVSLGLEFDHFLFPSILTENLKENSYVIPTPIQMQAIPIALSKRDLLACAQTGTGKSASFLLPLITRVFSTTDKLKPHHRCLFVPLAIILGPTREFCMQIEEQAKLFCKGLRNMKTALIVGGNPLPQQLHRLGQGVQIVVATPGRLNDILERHSDKCDLSFVQMLVIDEVDTMLQLGFQTQVERIMKSIPQSSQKMMFSATIPPSIEKIVTEMLSNPIFVSVGPPSTPNRSVKQIVLWVDEKSKKKRLFDLVSDGKHFIPPVVIFVGSKIGADMLADALNKVCDIPCASLHSDKPQQMRTQILHDFQNGSYQAIVSTSVLGRGIDLLNVVMVVNFDMPSTVDEYIHQVGRAGKLNKNGFAISFINNSNKDIFLGLFELFKDSSVKLPAELMNSAYLAQQQERRGRKIRKRKNDIVTTGNLMDLLKDHASKKRR